MDAMITKKADELAQELAAQATTIEDLNQAMRSLMKPALEKMLNTELEVHLGRGSHRTAETLTEPEADVPVESQDDSTQPRNRKNGFSPKTLQGGMGKLPLDILAWLLARPGCKQQLHAYATCYLVHRGERFTLAVQYVLKGTPLENVVGELLEIAKNAGIQPHVVLLDCGFFRASVIRWLQANGVPFLMPMVMRGRKPSYPKGPGGTYVFAAAKQSGASRYTWKDRNGQMCTVNVYRVRTRDKRSRRYRNY